MQALDRKAAGHGLQLLFQGEECRPRIDESLIPLLDVDRPLLELAGLLDDFRFGFGGSLLGRGRVPWAAFAAASASVRPA